MKGKKQRALWVKTSQSKGGKATCAHGGAIRQLRQKGVGDRGKRVGMSGNQTDPEEKKEGGKKVRKGGGGGMRGVKGWRD